MTSFSAIVIALCLIQAIHSREIGTGSGLCSDGEIKCDESKCIKKLQICDKKADCKDGLDESGCGFASEVSASTDNNTMKIMSAGKNNMTLSDNNVTLKMEEKESNLTMEDKNGSVTMEDKSGNMTMEDKNGNMIMKDKNGNMTMKDKNDNMTLDKSDSMTMSDKNNNMTGEDKNDNMTSDKNVSMTMGNKNGSMTMEDKNGNMTMEDKNGNMTMNDKNGNMIMKDKNGNTTMEDKNGNMTMEDKNGNMTMNDKNGNMTMGDKNGNMTTENKLKNAMMTSNANKTMDISNTTTNSASTIILTNKTKQAIFFNKGNSTEESWNSTEFDSTPNLDSTDVTTTENSSISMEGEMTESNLTEIDTLGNETETEACNMSDSIACEEFDPPCISAIAYCNDSVPCPSQNRSNVCGEDNLPIPKRKGKLTNLVEHHEPEEKNFINTNEIESDELATKESLKVTESENEGDNHLKIIIPVAVIGGLCIVALIIWFVTKRNKNIDSYALQ